MAARMKKMNESLQKCNSINGDSTMTKAEKEAVAKELENMSGVEVKLLKIQQELFVPKDKKNEYGSYNYRSCEDIEKAVKPLLNKYNCTLQLQTELHEIAGRIFVKAAIPGRARRSTDLQRSGMRSAATCQLSNEWDQPSAMQGSTVSLVCSSSTTRRTQMPPTSTARKKQRSLTQSMRHRLRLSMPNLREPVCLPK